MLNNTTANHMPVFVLQSDLCYMSTYAVPIHREPINGLYRHMVPSVHFDPKLYFEFWSKSTLHNMLGKRRV